MLVSQAPRGRLTKSPRPRDSLQSSQRGSTTKFEDFEVGTKLKILSSVSLRETESLDSDEICVLVAGQRCSIEARSKRPSQRSLLVSSHDGVGDVKGWLLPYFEDGRATVVVASSPGDDDCSPSTVPALATSEETSSSLRRRASDIFRVGEQVRALRPVILRTGVSLKSNEICELPPGQVCRMLEKGDAKFSRRLKVRVENCGREGWINAVQKTGEPNVELLTSSSSAGADVSSKKPEALTLTKGATIEVRSRAILRQDEQLESCQVAELPVGERCVVHALGTDGSCRRILVVVPAKNLRGWISTATKKGRELITILENGAHLSSSSGASSCASDSSSRSSTTSVCTIVQAGDGIAVVEDVKVNGSFHSEGAKPNREIHALVRHVHRLVAPVGCDNLGFSWMLKDQKRVIVKKVVLSSWAALSGLQVGDELIGLNGRSPAALGACAIGDELRKRPLHLAFSCERQGSMRTSAPLLTLPTCLPQGPQSVMQRSASSEPQRRGRIGGSAVVRSSSERKIIADAAKGVTTLGMKWLKSLGRGLVDQCEATQAKLAKELGAALAVHDNVQVNRLLDNAMTSRLVGEKAPRIITRTAKNVASRQLRDALKSDDSKVIKGALVAAKRLNAATVPEFQQAVDRYKKLKAIPDEWDVKKMLANRKGGTLFCRTAVLDPAVLERFQCFLDLTHRKVYTRDRNGEDVPDRLVLASVVEVHNDSRWVEYMTRQAEVRKEIYGEDAPDTHFFEVQTDSGSALESPEFSVHCSSDEEGMPKGGLPGPPLDATVNETFLFHGTNHVASDMITVTNFKVDLAGSNAGMLYGRRIRGMNNISVATRAPFRPLG
eukprot:TRINITY_DN11128_c0_g1_i1.p1 TRINITY_DN11128_c0_g1~~TRINITY_DN11128_c0_g1_i1.p1  ORF type:complete len:837 (-),score=105.36 TRINITY_DN11128_c0_g1_i1:35-2545(-)